MIISKKNIKDKLVTIIILIFVTSHMCIIMYQFAKVAKLLLIQFNGKKHVGSAFDALEEYSVEVSLDKFTQEVSKAFDFTFHGN